MTFEVSACKERRYRIDEVMLVMVPGRPTVFYATIKMRSFPMYPFCSSKSQYSFLRLCFVALLFVSTLNIRPSTIFRYCQVLYWIASSIAAPVEGFPRIK